MQTLGDYMGKVMYYVHDLQISVYDYNYSKSDSNQLRLYKK